MTGFGRKYAGRQEVLTLNVHWIFSRSDHPKLCMCPVPSPASYIDNVAYIKLLGAQKLHVVLWVSGVESYHEQHGMSQIAKITIPNIRIGVNHNFSWCQWIRGMVIK
jgi:hypothetical protein